MRAGACESVEAYPYSTLAQLVSGTCEIPICEPTNLQAHIPKKSRDKMAWLNRPTTKEAEALVGRGLRRFEFHFTKGNAFQRTFRTLQLEYGIEMTATNRA